jgi:hypothetical protein
MKKLIVVFLAKRVVVLLGMAMSAVIAARAKRRPFKRAEARVRGLRYVAASARPRPRLSASN